MKKLYIWIKFLRFQVSSCTTRVRHAVSSKQADSLMRKVCEKWAPKGRPRTQVGLLTQDLDATFSMGHKSENVRQSQSQWRERQRYAPPSLVQPAKEYHHQA